MLWAGIEVSCLAGLAFSLSMNLFGRECRLKQRFGHIDDFRFNGHTGTVGDRNQADARNSSSSKCQLVDTSDDMV